MCVLHFKDDILSTMLHLKWLKIVLSAASMTTKTKLFAEKSVRSTPRHATKRGLASEGQVATAAPTSSEGR